MRFAVVDPVGDGLAWVTRLRDEGHEVLYYVHERRARDIGTNIVQKTDSMHSLLAWAKLKPTIAMFMFSGMGKSGPKVPVGADDFRKAGVPTILGGGFCDRLEKDRQFGIRFAEKAGVRIPPYFEFPTISAASTFCKANKSKEWYFKTDASIDCDATKGGTGEQLVRYLANLKERVGDNKKNIVQMKIPGVAVSTAGWFNGHTFLEPFEGTIERKKFCNDEVGPSTGCSMNVVWFYKELPEIAKRLHFDRIAMQLYGAAAPPGLYDINAVVASEAGPWGPASEPYFLEWTPRCGWDSEATSHRLLKIPLGEFLERLTKGTLSEAPFDTNRLAMAIRLSMSPYPWEHVDGMKKTPRGTSLYGFASVWNDHFSGYSVAWAKDRGFYMAGDDGIVGLSVQVGTDLEAMNDKAVEYAKSLEPKSLMFRTDAYKALSHDAKELKKQGYFVPRGLLI